MWQKHFCLSSTIFQHKSNSLDLPIFSIYTLKYEVSKINPICYKNAERYLTSQNNNLNIKKREIIKILVECIRIPSIASIGWVFSQTQKVEYLFLLKCFLITNIIIIIIRHRLCHGDIICKYTVCEAIIHYFKTM